MANAQRTQMRCRGAAQQPRRPKRRCVPRLPPKVLAPYDAWLAAYPARVSLIGAEKHALEVAQAKAQSYLDTRASMLSMQQTPCRR